MTKEVEDIIKSKAYIELTDNERERLREWTQNEEEYNTMKWFLVGTASAFSSSKIQASPRLKKGVMEHLTQSKKKKGFWLNSVGVFMLPEGKKFYQKPAFQLGIAAVTVVGFLFFFNNNLNNNTLVINEQPVHVDTVVEHSLDTDENNEQLPNQSSDIVDALNKDVEVEAKFETSSNENKNFLDENVNHLEVQREHIFEAPMEELEESISMDYAPAIVEDAEEDAVLNLEGITVADELVGDENQRNYAEGVTNLGQTVTEESEDKLLFKRNNVKSKSERKGSERKKGFNNFTRNSEIVAHTDEEVSEEEWGGVGSPADVSSGEWIVPKSMHINKTKELNQLFHIEK